MPEAAVPARAAVAPVAVPVAAEPDAVASEPVPAPSPGVEAAEPWGVPAAERPAPIAFAVARPTDETADAGATRVVPAVDEEALGALAPRSSRRPAGRLGHVPWWMRLFLWLIAVPLGFVIVFLVARAFKLFSNNQMSDLFLANNTSRFWPVARLLPFVALVIAILVQTGVYLIARLRGRGRGHAGASANEISVPASRSRAR